MLKHISVLLTVAVAAQTAIAAQTIQGVVTLQSTIELSSKTGVQVPYNSGLMTLTYKDDGLSSVLNGKRLIVVQQGNQIAQLHLKHNEFRSFGDFETTLADDNPVILSGSTRSTLIGSSEREASQSCTFTGFCYSCTPGVDQNGNNTSECGYKLSTCSGNVPIRERVTTFQDDVSVHFLNSQSGQEIGVLKLAPKNRQETETLAVIGLCH